MPRPVTDIAELRELNEQLALGLALYLKSSARAICGSAPVNSAHNDRAGHDPHMVGPNP